MNYFYLIFGILSTLMLRVSHTLWFARWVQYWENGILFFPADIDVAKSIVESFILHRRKEKEEKWFEKLKTVVLQPYGICSENENYCVGFSSEEINETSPIQFYEDYGYCFSMGEVNNYLFKSPIQRSKKDLVEIIDLGSKVFGRNCKINIIRKIPKKQSL